MSCKRCGKCCKNPTINLDVPIDQDTQELSRWLQGHHCIPVKMDGNILGMMIPSICEHFKEIDGVKACAIYETRPKICREFSCQQ